MSSENETRDALAREMYWAEEATPRSRMDTPEVRDALHDFAMLMRDDERAMGRGGRDWVRRYAWSHFVDRIDACMEELVTYPSRGTDGTIPRFGLKW